MTRVLIVLAFALLLLPETIRGQKPADAATAPQTFEVASIRPSPSGSRNGWDYKGETFTISNLPVSDIVRIAYGIGPYYERMFAAVEGEPKWFADRYSVIAKTAGPVPLTRAGLAGMGPPLNSMLQSLLAERFRLVVHWESRERPGYALVVAARDGHLGPNMRRSNLDCDGFRAAMAAAREAGTPYPAPPAAPGWRGTVCGTWGYPKRDEPGTQELLMSTQPMSAIADQLARGLDRPVIDQTGLSGVFDIELSYSPGQRLATSPVPGGGSPVPAAPDLPAGPSLIEAVRDQLGLKLESARAMVEVLVIDSVQPPTEN